VSELDVRRAEPADVGEIVAMLSEAARWLLSRGIRQWPDPFPRDRVERLVCRGDVYLARLDGEPVATLALQWADPLFWRERPDDAGFVHALAVRRSHGGLGLGSRLLDWAEAEVGACGREFLRLDCLTENDALRRYYEGQGFEPRGEVAVDDFVAMRFERRCSYASRVPRGQVDPEAALTRDRHARLAGIRSQWERGRPTSPTQEGGGAYFG
jgi:GNAT superfamily N-acetyltransferase